MKKCTMCKESKELDNFHKNKKKKDGYNNVCKLCRKEYHSKWYSENKECVLEHNKKNKIRIKDFVLDYLSKNSCVDCGESDPIVLEFDHQRDKEFNISEGLSKMISKDRIMNEILKCEVVCANCHKRRTAITQNWYKNRTS